MYSFKEPIVVTWKLKGKGIRERVTWIEGFVCSGIGQEPK